MRRMLVCSLAVGLGALIAGASKVDALCYYRSQEAPEVEVWVDGEVDVFTSEDQVSLVVRASRDCYATVFMVDTDGYVHILYPSAPDDEAWFEGGVLYRIHLGGTVFYSPRPRGIAYVFAVASPWPFVYRRYGWWVFPGWFGFRIFGDPFPSCREFYLSLLPYDWVESYVGVGFTYFYVRQWVMYPRYLFLGHPGGRHRELCRVYRKHWADPYRVLRGVGREEHTGYSRMVRSKARGGELGRWGSVRNIKKQRAALRSVGVMGKGRAARLGPKMTPRSRGGREKYSRLYRATHPRPTKVGARAEKLGKKTRPMRRARKR